MMTVAEFAQEILHRRGFVVIGSDQRYHRGDIIDGFDGWNENGEPLLNKTGPCRILGVATMEEYLSQFLAPRRSPLPADFKYFYKVVAE